MTSELEMDESHMANYRFHKNVLLIYSNLSKDIRNITNIIKEIKPSGHVIIWQPWEALDERFEEYLHHNYECNPTHSENYQEFEDTLVKYGIECYLLVGCDYSDAYSNIKTNPLKNFEVLFWPTALLHYTYHGMTTFYGKKPSELFDPHKSINTLYLNLNNHERAHRCKLIDLLCKFDLFNYGINTWNVRDSPCIFKYFTPKRLTFENDREGKMAHQVYSEELLNVNNLIDVVGETAPCFLPDRVVGKHREYMFHTEKTYRSILFGKPFLVLGNKGQNNNLQKYGVTLYGKIFDYHFDDTDSMDLRCLGIIDNLFTYKDRNLNEVRDDVVGIAQVNIDTLTSIVYNDEYIPSKLKSLISEHREEYRILLRDFNSWYSGSFGISQDWMLTETVFKEIYQ
jgi:hypothetical protein